MIPTGPGERVARPTTGWRSRAADQGRGFRTTAARRPGQRRPIGLGHYLCRLVAAAHGGTIGSGARGAAIACAQHSPKGAVFTVGL